MKNLAVTIDVKHDRLDEESGKRIECPMSHLWAQGGQVDTFYGKDGALGIWRHWAPHAHEQAMKGSQLFPGENPDETALIVKKFLSV